MIVVSEEFAVQMHYSYNQHVTGVSPFSMDCQMVVLVFQGKMISIQFTIGGPVDNTLVSEVATLYAPLFTDILQTFHIVGTEAVPSSKRADDYGQSFSSAIPSTVLVVSLLPLLILILLALVLRYLIIRRSVRRADAAMVSITIGAIGVAVVYYILGSFGIVSTVIGSLLLYTVLRIGD